MGPRFKLGKLWKCQNEGKDIEWMKKIEERRSMTEVANFLVKWHLFVTVICSFVSRSLNATIMA